MARPKRKTNGKPASVAPDAVATPIVLATDRDTPVFYVNFAEIGFTAHDFFIAAVRTPAKLPPALVEDIRKGNALTLNADIQLIIPPTLVPGLITALTTAKDLYEKAVGTAIKDMGVKQ